MPLYDCKTPDCTNPAKNGIRCWGCYNRLRRRGTTDRARTKPVGVHGKIPTIKASPTYLAYVAGFFDGEGTVGIYRQKKRWFTYRVSVSQKTVHGGVLLEMQRVFGGSITHKKGNDMSCWQLTTAGAYAFLKSIRPYLLIKAPQADLFMQTIEAVRNGEVIDLDTVVVQIGEMKRASSL